MATEGYSMQVLQMLDLFVMLLLGVQLTATLIGIIRKAKKSRESFKRAVLDCS